MATTALRSLLFYLKTVRSSTLRLRLPLSWATSARSAASSASVKLTLNHQGLLHSSGPNDRHRLCTSNPLPTETSVKEVRHRNGNTAVAQWHQYPRPDATVAVSGKRRRARRSSLPGLNLYRMMGPKHGGSTIRRHKRQPICGTTPSKEEGIHRTCRGLRTPARRKAGHMSHADRYAPTKTHTPRRLDDKEAQEDTHCGATPAEDEGIHRTR